MSKIIKEDIKKLEQVVKEEFPDDPALQQVHISRKIIAKEAELAEMSFIDYVKLQTKKKHIRHRRIN